MMLDQAEIREMLEVATVAARLAGQRAMEDIRYTKSSIKNNNEIVTEADERCQKIITDRIKETYPDHGFIAEEGPDGKMLLQSPRGSNQIWWVIDPIDGTNNYAHKMLCFTVSIAAVYQGEPVIGVIFDPPTESMFTSAKGTDSQLNASRIDVSDEDIDKFASFGIDSHFDEQQANAIYEMMRRTKFRNLGTTALQFAYVAKGSFIGSITTQTKLWDIAAAIPLIENAGGIVTDLQGKPIFPMDVDKYSGENFVVLAANKKTHQQLLDLFNK